MPRLTPKQRKFCEEYLTDLNASGAALRAGYSEKTAYAIGHENLRKPEIVAEIQRLRDELAASPETVDPAEVLNKLTAIIRADLRAVCAWGPEGVVVRPSDELSEDAAGAVSEVICRPGKDGNYIKVRLHDKLRALELAAKILGMDGKEPEDGPGVDWVNVGKQVSEALQGVLIGRPTHLIEHEKGE